jgi:probable HAF family extracellular repeat protein
MSGFVYSTLDDPEGGDPQVVSGVNNSGTVVGSYDSSTDVVTSFVGNDGTYTVVTDPSAMTGDFEGTEAEAINNSGTVVGYYDTASDQNVGFMEVDGSFTDISDPSAATGAFTGTEVYGINDVGDMWGEYTAADYGAATFVNIGGVFTTITIPAAVDGITIAGISDGGTVAGSYQLANGSNQSFVWTDGTYTTLNDPAAGTGAGAGTVADAINATGTVAGYYVTVSGNAVGFVYDDGTFTSVTDPSAGSAAGAGTFITSINASGELAGYYATNADAQNDLAQGFIDDNGTFTDIDDPSYGAILTGETGPMLSLNDSGDLLEVYSDASDATVMALVEPACYLPGTMIRTSGGDVPIEALTAGNAVLTVDGDMLPVLRLDRRRVDCRRHPEPDHVLPVRVQAGAFGPGLPVRDLFLSPDHAIFAEGVLIPVKHLINGSSIRQIDMPEVTYFHVVLDEHAVILAEGLPAESYLDTGHRPARATAGAEAEDVSFIMDAFGCAPLRVMGAEVERVRAVLAERGDALTQSVG